MKEIKYEYLTPVIRDELAGLTENFELLTKSVVKKIRGFEKSTLKGNALWNHYLFTKSVQMGTKSVHRPGGML